MFFDDIECSDKKPDIYENLATLNGEELFLHLNAKRWIERYRVEHSDGSLDMIGSAERVGIPLASPDEEYTSDAIVTKAYITGVSVDVDEPIRIHISPRNMEEMARMSLGHEFGHFFLFQQGYLHDDSGLKLWAEKFCDVFGRECALPSEYLEYIDTVDGSTVSSLMEMFKVDHQTVFMQLMKVGKLPKAVLVDTSFGETPNPDYSNRLTRIVVCYNCEMGIPHSVDFGSAPIIDMSYDSQIFRKMSLNACSYVSPLDLSLIETVEREHGRL